MHPNWKGPFSKRLQRAASDRGRRMAQARWQRDRQRRVRLSAESIPARIAARIVVIVRETRVREFTLFDFDGPRECRRQLLAANRFAASALT
jgi:hypothetical protein